MSIQRLFRPRRWAAGALIFLVALLATGCSTTFLEYSGRMANENSNNHVKPYQGASTSDHGNAEAVRPIAPVPMAGHLKAD